LEFFWAVKRVELRVQQSVAQLELKLVDLKAVLMVASMAVSKE
jgi:hypothetical protein